MMCDEYRRKSAAERKHYADNQLLCVNCLGKHKITDCPSKRLCSVCAEKHHTSLHDTFRKAPVEKDIAQAVHVAYSLSRYQPSVLLATARILVADRFGNPHAARDLIDQGSETTIITENLAQRLRLPRRNTAVAVFGVGGHQTGVAKGLVVLKLSARSGGRSVTSSAIILLRLTGYASKSVASTRDWPHVQGLELADPDPTSTDPIDVLLGADIYSSIVLEGLLKGAKLHPLAKKTIFGWILSSPIKSEEERRTTTTHQCTVGLPLSSLVRRFWEQEELPLSPSPLTKAEMKCEELFALSHTRTPEGRYVVRLPVASMLPDLSETRKAAVQSLLRTEKRFQKKTTNSRSSMKTS
ncbi:hypothetical protein RF55_15370 [Lasius niger]|uniref:Peptidase A2 domain-containing protein n=1 Tax=Lasius niger TaxID=67767 RepID=A0A0J7K6G2_LASNI|nr:hypothetical protein RF55_15370 [Lasius niger]